MHLISLHDILWLINWAFPYCSISLKCFHFPIACILFQLALKITSASFDAVPSPTQDSSAGFPDLLLIQGVLLLLQSGDQLPQSDRGMGSQPIPLGTPARVSSPAATGHSALLVRGHHCSVNREVYLDFSQTFVWSELRAVITRRHFCNRSAPWSTLPTE